MFQRHLNLVSIDLRKGGRMLSAPDLALVRTLIEGIQCGNELTDCPAADGKAMLVVDGARLKRVGNVGE